MGFFRRLIYGKKNQYEEQISNGEDGSFESQIVNVKDPVARNQYVDTCIEQISEAVDNIDSLTREYETVTTYLTDMEELEALPEPNMQEIREQAAKILQLSMSKDSYQSRQDRMKESDYRRMQGLEEEVQEGYFVTDACIGCKLCYSKCPQKCIDISGRPVVIQQQNCLHCGNCYEICPARAIVKRG